MSYTVKIMSDKEFESLPYPETSVSFGIADPKSNSAYVRYNPNKDVMSYLINHEVEHLIDGVGGEHSDHYRNGVYYKGFGDSMEQQAPPSTLGNLILSGVGQMAGKIQQQQYDQYLQSMRPNVFRMGGAPGQPGYGGDLNADTISRVKGFFAGRNPSQGGF